MSDTCIPLGLKCLQLKVLCDPWLVGSLTFLDAPLVYEGKKDTSKLGIQAADGADFVLLTQVSQYVHLIICSHLKLG